MPLDALAEIGPVCEEIESAFVRGCADVARAVLVDLWEDDVALLCGERWKPRSGARTARAGACASEIRLGGERIQVRRPRVRSHDGREVELPSFRFAAERDRLDRAILEQLAFSVATGHLPKQEVSPTVESRFLRASAERLRDSLARPGRDFSPALILGGLAFREHWMLVALGVATNGRRSLLGVRAGSPENGHAVESLLADVVPSQLPGGRPELVIIGEAVGLREGVRRQLGRDVLLHRCPAEKRRRVLGLLPPEEQPGVLRALLAGYGAGSEVRARRALLDLARRIGAHSPAAAEALRDGLDETLTLHRLGVRPAAASAAREVRHLHPFGLSTL